MKGHMAVRSALTGRDWRLFRGAYRDKDAVLMNSGMGRENAEKATSYVLEHYPVSTLVAFGFASALTANSKVGDIIVCSRLCCADGLTEKSYHTGYSHWRYDQSTPGDQPDRSKAGV